MTPCRWTAAAIGAIGAGTLSLSVVHVTTSIAQLTGSSPLLSALLALGIDAGLVATEIAGLVCHGSDRQARIIPWAKGYTLTALAMSCVLNAFAFARHASDGMTWCACLLGILLPALVLALFRIGSELWLARQEGGAQ
jgi:hypothetical protein